MMTGQDDEDAAAMESAAALAAAAALLWAQAPAFQCLTMAYVCMWCDALRRLDSE